MRPAAVVVCDDREDIASRALDLVVEGLASAVGIRGEAHLALTGGSSASALFALLRTDARARRVEWDRVHVWQGDERFVPLEHPERNWAGALRDWLEADDGPGVPAARRHPVPCDAALEAGHDVDWAAARYAEEIEAVLPRQDSVPAFDVVLLGVGTDGHILSAFPGTPPLAENSVPAMPVAAPTHVEPHLPRVTIAPFLLEAVASIVVMVPGAAKAAVVAECLNSPFDPTRLPAQLALRSTAVWLLEPASAADL